MDGEGRSAIEAQAGAESLRKLRGRFRMAIVRGRVDMQRPGLPIGRFRSSRECVHAAIERHFSHQNPRRIERRFFEWRRRYKLVNWWLRQGMPHAERVVEVEGLGHLEEALSGGSGAILATAHFGHGRLIKPVLGIHGWPPLLVGGDDAGRWPPIAAPDLPITLNLRPHLAALRENRPVIVVVDGQAGTTLTRIPVGGIGCYFGPGAMRIARAAGSAVLPTFVVDEGTLLDPLGIRLVIHAPLSLQSSDDAVADVLENLRRFAGAYAEELERNPHNVHWDAVTASGEMRPPRDPRTSGGDLRDTLGTR